MSSYLDSATFVGPVYVMHAYSAATEAEIALNVESARSISVALNKLGVATVSPLQESIGREGTLPPRYWYSHGIAQLSVCRAAVCPKHCRESLGVHMELDSANRDGIRVFRCWRIDDQWKFETEFYEWIELARKQMEMPF